MKHLIFITAAAVGLSASAFSPVRDAKDLMAKVYFYYSAMNAGKTTTLLQSAHNYHERGMRTLLFTPALDTRHGEGTIASRIGLRAQGRRFARHDDLLAATKIDIAERGPLHCVLVDEAQFLSQPQVLQLCEVADQLKIPVLCYGLRTDFQAKLFPGSAALLALADSLVELKAVCECGRKATMNLRVDSDGHAVVRGQQTEIGGNDRYIALCRKHFFERLHESRARQLSLGLARPR